LEKWLTQQKNTCPCCVAEKPVANITGPLRKKQEEIRIGYIRQLRNRVGLFPCIVICIILAPFVVSIGLAAVILTFIVTVNTLF
jgi:hypothetical protein